MLNLVNIPLQYNFPVLFELIYKIRRRELIQKEGQTCLETLAGKSGQGVSKQEGCMPKEKDHTEHS